MQKFIGFKTHLELRVMNFFDLHADTPLFLDDISVTTAVNMVNHPFEQYTQTMAIFIREDDLRGFETYKSRLCSIKRFSKLNNISVIKQKEKPINGVLLSVENAAFLAEDLNRVYQLYNDGVRMLSLTWNGDNQLASGAGGDNGISQKGKEVIKIMNDLGMALDISHLSHKSALQACMLADKVLATHSCLYSVHPHRRNIRDDVLKALKEKDGIIGLCFYPEFLGCDNVTLQLKRNIDRLLCLGMENNISIGTDFDGAEMAPNLNKTAHVLDLFNDFVDLGLKKILINKIFYENAIAFFVKMCENK